MRSYASRSWKTISYHGVTFQSRLASSAAQKAVARASYREAELELVQQEPIRGGVQQELVVLLRLGCSA